MVFGGYSRFHGDYSFLIGVFGFGYGICIHLTGLVHFDWIYECEGLRMLKVKNTLVMAGLFTAWPVLSFGMADPNKGLGIPPGDGSGDLISTMMQSIFFIIVLGGIAFYVSKKFMPKLRPSAGRDINIRETIHLGPSKTVHLIEVGEKTFLVGSTSDNITMLADVTETLEDSCEDEII